MNKLILINGKGESYDLLDATRSPTYQIEGMGYGDDTDFLRIGSSYFPLEEKSEQRELEFKLLFMDKADRNYYEFVKHARHAPLLLQYANENGEFFIPCKLRSISKIDQYRPQRYIASVSMWMTGNPYRIISAYNSGAVSDGKTYDYTYDYTYTGETLNTVMLRSDSYMTSPCILTIYGEVTNPVWRHYCNGELVETGAFTGTIPSGHSLVIDAKSMPYSIIEYDAAGVMVADRYQLCDFSTERFMHVDEGENYYVISHDSIDALQIRAEAYLEYETV